eukprot:3731291-Rhodomonas_salina.3
MQATQTLGAGFGADLRRVWQRSDSRWTQSVSAGPPPAGIQCQRLQSWCKSPSKCGIRYSLHPCGPSARAYGPRIQVINAHGQMGRLTNLVGVRVGAL